MRKFGIFLILFVFVLSGCQLGNNEREESTVVGSEAALVIAQETIEEYFPGRINERTKWYNSGLIFTYSYPPMPPTFLVLALFDAPEGVEDNSDYIRDNADVRVSICSETGEVFILNQEVEENE
ncbi:MAG: membrane lipoprotein lipid attachment site-containing protein [Oscillospiraceae bacterium]|nr:membrane lipoprotein lipid attachment site-containing protein [Oscillospiraceae bacterium]